MMESSSHPSDASEQVSGTNENPVDAMELFRGQLEDILNTYGSADRLLEEKISSLEKDEDNLEEESVKAGTQTSSSSEMKQAASVLLEALGEEGLVLLQSLNTLQSPEDKLETVLRKYAELLKEQRNEQVKLKLLQKKQNVLVEQRDQLQLEHSKGILARSRLEKLCGDLHQHNATLTDNMLQKNQEDERKRTEIHSHFQNTVVDIQAQIEQHSSRNTKLSQENIELANRLTSIIQKYEKREESLEKLFKQKELQQQLSDAKLEDAQLRLKDAEEKHQREKEYLLREAIDKTKKCYTMKQQELQMKKQLLTHAAEWKLQVKELKEQNTVMQAQLVLYSQKFDEFQATLAKSNEVYAVFKQEMEKVTKNMKKLEKESNMWKIRFESCNKALTEMIEERSERGKELELFTVKIDKLETLCRALQEERKVLYEKIKEIRLQAVSASAPPPDVTEEQIPDLGQLQVSEPLRNPALTAEMEKLWKEQERLQEFAASLLASTAGDVDSSDSEEESAESKPPAPAVPEVMKPPIAITQNHAVEDGINEAVQLESHQQETKAPKVEALNEEPAKAEPPNEELPKEPPKAEPHKADPPKVEPPKAEPPNEELPNEPPKAEPPKVEPPKAEPPNEELPKEPPKAEPHKAESHKAEPPKVEPPNVEPPKAEPPKAEPPKVEPPKAEPPKVEPPKAEPPKVEPPKVEPPKVEPPKAEPPKVEPPKVADKNSAGVKPSQKLKHTQKSNKLNSADHQEPQPHMEQDPKAEKTKQAAEAETECKEAEPQESKPGANKPQGKKQSSSKRKGAAKGMKKS